MPARFLVGINPTFRDVFGYQAKLAARKKQKVFDLSSVC